MKKILVICAFVFSKANAQELFVQTEPASNMATDALGVRLIHMVHVDKTEILENWFSPELMYGINKNWMIHAQAIVANHHKPQYKFQGINIYSKWRFFSNDEEHKHFRMALYSRIAYNPQINYNRDASIMGDQSGAMIGWVGTQLINKLAVSGNLMYTGLAIENNFLPKQLIQYSLSAGYLIYPKKYTSYKNMNINAYVEVLGKNISGSSNGSILNGNILEIAPSLQFIFSSTTRIDIGAKYEIVNTAFGYSRYNVLIKLEHNIFNAFGRK